MIRHIDSSEINASEDLPSEATGDAGREGMSKPVLEDSERLQKDLDDASRLANERLDQLMRCRAELDNVLKRTAREKEEQAKYASERLIAKLLCVLDSLEQASKHDEGSKVLFNQMLDILRGEGLAPIDAIGKKFDPYTHEAMFQVNSEDIEEGTVAQEIQRGYTLNSKVIRFSKVAVAKR